MIRLAGTSDIPRIDALMKSVAGFWDASWRPDVLERALGSSETIALVHHEDDSIDGFVCGHDVGFRAYLSELVVSPASRGRGVGSQLISELERHLADRGCSVLIADVWRETERFYRSQGWAPPDVVLLRKRLGAPAADRQGVIDPRPEVEVTVAGSARPQYT